MAYDQNLQTNPRIQIDKRNAYHQAGYAAAIYLGNQQKQLPAIHFHIVFKPQEFDEHFTGRFLRMPNKYTAKVEGGRLIKTLPLSSLVTNNELTPAEQEQYLCAFEADVINLLAGPLAEAKYVALRDDETFNANLVYLGTLQFYGGKTVMDTITEYMECFMPDPSLRKQKLAELFLAAYSFVNQHSNWNAISTLADYIRTEPKTIIPCEDLIALLESQCHTADGQSTSILPTHRATLLKQKGKAIPCCFHINKPTRSS